MAAALQGTVTEKQVAIFRDSSEVACGRPVSPKARVVGSGQWWYVDEEVGILSGRSLAFHPRSSKEETAGESFAALDLEWCQTQYSQTGCRVREDQERRVADFSSNEGGCAFQ